MSNYKIKQEGYRPDIDGLRAVAVLSVLIYHAFPAFCKGGFIGVDIFFVISGFLICGILLRSLKSNSFSLRQFYQRRICRIFPALFVVLLATLTFGWFSLSPAEYESLGKHTAGGAVFIANFITWREAGYWDIASRLKPLLHLWSLGIEEQYYLVFPCILWAAWKKKIHFTAVISAILILSFLLNMYYHDRNATLTFYAPFTRFWELLAGATLASVLSSNSPVLRRLLLRLDSCLNSIFSPRTQSNGRSLQNVASVLGFALIILALLLCRAEDGYPGPYALLPVLGATLVIASGSQAWLNRMFLSNKVAVGIGLISYPLYLWHWPILSYLYILGWESSEAWVLIRIVACIAALTLSFFTYKYVECPIRFGAHKKQKTIALLITIVCIAICGRYIDNHNGILNRIGMDHGYQRVMQGAMSGQGKNFYPEDIAAGKKYAPNISRTSRFVDVGSQTTVAVIGDSHAKSAFFGLKAQCTRVGLNSFTAPYEFFDLEERKASVLQLFKEKDDITDVFLFFRGVMHLTGDDVDGVKNNKDTLRNQFKPVLQDLIDILVSMHKNVYIVSENPVLSYDPKEYVSRPLGYDKLPLKPLPPTRQEVLAHQADYIKMLNELHGATIINTINTFCPKDNCLDILDNGQVMYYDDDHLSISGSLLQAEQALAPYIEEIAKRSAEPK